ncbi:MAG: DPP IV N-terminal domain-containing protein [Opitutales bacterium]|nr:DPP IV N-terminal domain-containing protein [Opitutales bacterium]
MVESAETRYPGAMKKLLSVLLVALLPVSLVAETHEWKNTLGKTIKAEFVSATNETVTISMQGKTFVVKLADLAPQSRALAAKLRVQKATVQELVTKVKAPKAEVRKLALPLTGRLAFHSYTAYDLDDSGQRWLDGQIHICNFPAKTAVTIPEIEKRTIHAMNPIFNRNGTQMTFMALPIGPKYGADWPESFDLFVYDFRSGKLVNISKKARLGLSVDEDPVFTPDGGSLIFKRNREDLWMVDLKTFRVQSITDDGKRNEESGPRISPDGKWIFYWNGDGAEADIFRIPVTGGVTELMAGLPGIQEMFPVYMNNGRLAYTRWTSPKKHDDEIYFLDLANGKHQGAAFNSTNGANDSDPFDINNWVGFSSNRTENGKGGWDLYLGDPSSPTPIHLRQLSTSRHDLGGTYTPSVPGHTK